MKFTAALFRDGKVVVDMISGEFTTSAVGPKGKLEWPKRAFRWAIRKPRRQSLQKLGRVRHGNRRVSEIGEVAG